MAAAPSWYKDAVVPATIAETIWGFIPEDAERVVVFDATASSRFEITHPAPSVRICNNETGVAELLNAEIIEFAASASGSTTTNTLAALSEPLITDATPLAPIDVSEPSKSIALRVPIVRVPVVGRAVPLAVAWFPCPLLSFHWLTSPPDCVMLAASLASHHPTHPLISVGDVTAVTGPASVV
jgi:hypothetical protein